MNGYMASKMMKKVLGGVGFILLMLGVAGMDSENMVAPIIFTCIGILVLFLYAKAEEK